MHKEEDYGRLEFLGDAVLGLIVTSFIFYCLGADFEKGLKPGQLSDLRSSIVKNDCLAFLACARGLDRCLLHSCPTLHTSINAFSSVRPLQCATPATAQQERCVEVLPPHTRPLAEGTSGTLAVAACIMVLLCYSDFAAMQQIVCALEWPHVLHQPASCSIAASDA